MSSFGHRIVSLDELRAVIPPPDAPAIRKNIDHLDAHCRAFIAASPFLVVASVSADGAVDASPRGGPPGFVRVLDERRLAMPDYPGNRRLNSWTNVLETSRVQLIFFVPGVLETLRVSGRACLTRDPALLAELDDRGRTPKLALGIDVEVAFLHCGKALRRAELWEPDSWPARDVLPPAARIFIDHMGLPAIAEDTVAEHLARDYDEKLWPE